MLRRVSLLVFCFVLLAQTSWSDTITRYHYSPQATDINRININDGDDIPPMNGLPHINVSGIVSNDESMVNLSPSVWSGDNWTHFNEFRNSGDSYYQKALKKNTSSTPGYGSTVVQTSGLGMGMHLNTFGTDLVNSTFTAASLQYFVGWDNGKTIWYSNEKLCVSFQAKVATSYISGGAVNQAMCTLIFKDFIGNKSFFVNVMLFDSRSGLTVEDYVKQDTQDTALPIAISWAQSQNQDNPAIKYTSTLNSYGAPLLSYQLGQAPNVKGHYAFSIDRTEFQTILDDVKSEFSEYSDVPERYKLRVLIIGPEINTISNGVVGDGHIGMSVENVWAYNMTE